MERLGSGSGARPYRLAHRRAAGHTGATASDRVPASERRPCDRSGGYAGHGREWPPLAAAPRHNGPALASARHLPAGCERDAAQRGASRLPRRNAGAWRRSRSISPNQQVSASQPASQPAAQSVGPDILTSALPLNTASASSAPHWASLGATPPLAHRSATATPGSSVALSLGPSLSALMTAQGAQVSLTGGQAALRLLAPGASVTPAAKAAATSTPLAAGAGSVILGLVAPSDSFSDSFTGERARLALGHHQLVLLRRAGNTERAGARERQRRPGA